MLLVECFEEYIVVKGENLLIFEVNGTNLKLIHRLYTDMSFEQLRIVSFDSQLFLLFLSKLKIFCGFLQVND